MRTRPGFFGSMSSPKLVLTLLVRDEEDIVESTIRFHLSRGVDYIIATNNRSEDRTGEILRGFERQGVLRYIDEPEDTYDQGHWVTRMARIACTEFHADWVINGDADEFWWPEQRNLKEILAAVPAGIQAVRAERTNFVPRQMPPGAHFAETMTVRERDSRNPCGGPLPGKVCHRAYADVTITQGNHAAYRNGFELVAASAPISILHFPMRTFRQFENKIAKGGAAYQRNTRLPVSTGSTWRALYETWKRGGLPDYYNASVLSERSVESGLKDGSLIFDDRLKRAFDC